MAPAFTLIELLGVVVVIAVLVVIVLGVSTYTRQGLGRAKARSQIAAIAMALEAYKADWGYYPRTGSERLSADGSKEATNNWYLYRALSGVHGKRYMTFPASLVWTNPAPAMTAIYQTVSTVTNSGIITTNFAVGWNIPGVPNIFDPWKNPYVYYNSPTTPYGLTNSGPNLPSYGTVASHTLGSGYTLGGQVNVPSYDLFSFGPDGYTYVPGVTSANVLWGNRLINWVDNSFTPWAKTNSAADDITNWGR